MIDILNEKIPKKLYDLSSFSLTEFQTLILLEIIEKPYLAIDLGKKFHCSSMFIGQQLRNICRKLGVNYWGWRSIRAEHTRQAILQKLEGYKNE